MRIIKIEKNLNGSHVIIKGRFDKIPDGFAVIPDDMKIVSPFVNITTQEKTMYHEKEHFDENTGDITIERVPYSVPFVTSVVIEKEPNTERPIKPSTEERILSLEESFSWLKNAISKLFGEGALK